MAQIAEVFETEVKQFNTLLTDIETACTEVKVTDNYISMPIALQQKFIAIVNGLSNSTKTTQSTILSLQSVVKSIQTELNSTMGDNKIVNGLLNILLGILQGISLSFNTLYQDVVSIDQSFTNLGNVVQKPNVLIRKLEFFFGFQITLL